MKRFFLFIIVLFLCGCEKNVVDNNLNTSLESFSKKEVEEVKEENPVKISLYYRGEKKDNINISFPALADIISLECYYTDDNNIISGEFKDVFNYYYSQYEVFDQYRIGYRIRFSTTDGDFDKYIYRPGDVMSFFNYIQIYLYDDIHQESSWYSHVEDSDYNENTLLTSIKLTGSVYIDRVSDDIEVTVFSYKNSDIDSEGKYQGNNKYTVVLHRI